jgi:hypothetical protein
LLELKKQMNTSGAIHLIFLQPPTIPHQGTQYDASEWPARDDHAALNRGVEIAWRSPTPPYTNTGSSTLLLLNKNTNAASRIIPITKSGKNEKMHPLSLLDIDRSVLGEGDTVVLKDLKKQESLNFRKGVLGCFDESNMRWKVVLDAGKTIQAKPENLVKMKPAMNCTWEGRREIWRLWDMIERNHGVDGLTMATADAVRRHKQEEALSREMSAGSGNQTGPPNCGIQ